jgi:nucleotide-binding universal stress UspA family protein
MKPIKKILFPVDLSVPGTAMTPFVGRAAALFAAEITLIHVFDPRALDLSEELELAIRPMGQVLEDHQSAQQHRLETFSALPAMRNAAHSIIRGDPPSVITAFARENAFDLIVMPTHSGRFRQKLIGSTTARVIDEATCPVLTSRHAETIHPRALGHRQWLYASDLSEHSEFVLSQAKAAALQAGSGLSVVHVVELNTPDLLDLTIEEEVRAIRSASDQLNQSLDRHGLHGQGEVIVGPIKEALIRSIVAQEADMLIIGRSDASPGSGLMTDLTYAMVRDAPVPVLCV